MKTDVLILGAGLAGLRAAWAALETSPGLDVHIVSLRHGPSGSSFANRNNRLGFRAPVTDADREATVQLACELGAPGFVDERLVTLLYEEAAERLDELARLGLDFGKDGNGDEGEDEIIQQLVGCFGGPASCAVFSNLSGAFTEIRNHVAELGAKFISNHEVLGLVTDSGAVQGAWLGSLDDGGPLCVSAGSVVMALGGPAPLFARNITGPGTPGNAYGLLAEAGVTLENTRYMQGMWSVRGTRDFRMPGLFLAPGTKVRCADGSEITLTDEPMLEHAEIRRTHCPASYGESSLTEDAAMDHWLLDRADQCRTIEIKAPGREWEHIYLAAHAGNGGAIVDEDAFTGVDGLYAIGECATGMHGANRLGGAMIAATQVFGRRAGMAAAQTARERDLMSEPRFSDACLAGVSALPAQDWDDFEIFEEIGDGLQAHALYRPTDQLPAFAQRLREIEATPASRRVQLAARAALAVVG